MHDQPVIISCWLESEHALIDLAISIGEFAFDDSGWRRSFIPPYDGKFLFSSTWSADGRQQLISPGLTHEDQLAVVARSAAKGEGMGLVLISPASWRNPFILEPERFDNWGCSIRISTGKAPGKRYSIHFVFHQGGLWFSGTNTDFAMYDKDHDIKEWKKGGYKIHQAGDQAGWKLPEWGATYMPAEVLAQENRRRLLGGAAKLIKAYNPTAASLQGWKTADYDWRRKRVKFPEDAKAYMLYYHESTAYNRTVGGSYKESEFIALRLDGVNLHVEEEHFGFLNL